MPLSKVKTNSITDNAVTTSQIADTAVHGRRNLIINSGMQIAQRGTSQTGTGFGSIDRMKFQRSGVSSTCSQQTLSSGAPYDDGFRYFARMANTAVSSATSAYQEIQVSTIEAQDIASSGWDYTNPNSYITVSFWARSSLAGTYNLWLGSADGTTHHRYHSFTLVADTWKKVTFTTGGNSNLQFDNNNGAGFYTFIIPYYGTDWTGGEEVDANDWYTRGGNDDAYLPDYAQNWCNTASATFDVTGVQVEVGDKATPHEHRSYHDELLACMRYYEGTTYAQANANGHPLHVYALQQHSSNRAFPTRGGNFMVPKRATPTIRVDGSQTGTANELSGYSSGVDYTISSLHGTTIHSVCGFFQMTDAPPTNQHIVGMIEADAEL